MDSKLENLLLREQVRMLYVQWKSMISGCAFVVLITTATLWNFVDKRLILLWVVANVIFLAMRSYSLRKELNKSRDKTTAIKEEQFGNKAIFVYRCYSLTNSLLWGVVPLVLFTENFPIFSIALLTHGGYIAAAVSATASYDLKAFFAFVFPATAMWVIGTAINGGMAYIPHIVLFSIYPLIMTVFALRINNAFKEQILLRLENMDLTHNLRKQRDRAENAMQEKNRFLAATSHDLRQPVHALGLFVASLEPYLEKEKPKIILDQIKQTTDNMGSLFHSLLDLSKLDADVVQNTPSHIFLKPLMQMLATEYQESVERKRLTIKTECEPGLVAYVDSALFERILRNLVSNAVNYTDTGTITLSAIRTDSQKLMIRCEDTGRGIPLDEQQKIFSEYHQLENPERDRKKGLGLGLAIVRRLCTIMNLQLHLYSEPGRGSTFSLTLDAGDAELVSSTVKEANSVGILQLNVIVIDDEVDILIGMNALLSSWGCNVVTATSGKQAIEELASHPGIDVIIADFRLRNHESGLGVIQSIRNHYGVNLAAALITGDTAPERLRQATLADVEVLHKPVEPETLKRLLASLHGTVCRAQSAGELH